MTGRRVWSAGTVPLSHTCIRRRWDGELHDLVAPRTQRPGSWGCSRHADGTVRGSARRKSGGSIAKSGRGPNADLRRSAAANGRRPAVQVVGERVCSAGGWCRPGHARSRFAERRPPIPPGIDAAHRDRHRGGPRAEPADAPQSSRPTNRVIWSNSNVSSSWCRSWIRTTSWRL